MVLTIPEDEVEDVLDFIKNAILDAMSADNTRHSVALALAAGITREPPPLPLGPREGAQDAQDGAVTSAVKPWDWKAVVESDDEDVDDMEDALFRSIFEQRREQTQPSAETRAPSASRTQPSSTAQQRPRPPEPPPSS
ncbi:uncharacterized protein LOC135394099 isoform X2 [Ornithodoros turicata]